MLGADGWSAVFELRLKDILTDIRDDLEEFGVHTRPLVLGAQPARGRRDRSRARPAAEKRRRLREGRRGGSAQPIRRREGPGGRAVERRANLFASDIAYHLSKRERGFEQLVDILGADHHGYLARVRAGLVAMGQPGDSPRGPAPAVRDAVSRRREGADVDALGRVRDAASCGAKSATTRACFFYVMRSNDQHLDFDLELAKSHSNDNPVYYIQYAHARCAA